MRKTIAIAVVFAALTLLHSNIASTNAVFVGTKTSAVNQFAGATFSPTVAPVVSPTSHPNNISLSWSAVTISSGGTITYVVMRYPATGPGVAVCTGADVPTQSGSTMSCSDKSVVSGTAYTYTEQPVVYVGATATWSLKASVASVSVCSKKCA